jgi:DedD protein
MDSRAKQRVTGAVILVALVVMLVPELLKGPKSSNETPAEEGVREIVIPVNSTNPERPAPPPEEAPVNLATPMATNPERATPGERAVPAEAASPEPAEPVVSTPAPAPKPADVKPADTRPATPRPETRPAPRLESGSFVVQLGSFGVRENADRLARDMNDKGFTTFITPTVTNGRRLYQVRVGPTRDRASAEALAARLKREGQSGSIISIP